MNKFIIIFLFVCAGLNAQYATNGNGQYSVKYGSYYKSEPHPNYTDTSTTGLGTILWSENFNSESLNASVSSSEIAAIIGTPMDIYNFDNNGQQQIIEYVTDDMAFWGEMDNGGTGGAGGWQFNKILRQDAGAASNLNNLTEVWFSMNAWFPDGFNNFAEGADGKMPGGLQGSTAFYDYDPEAGWETYIDGFLTRDYYQPSEPINSPRHLNYWPDMTADYGVKSGAYYSDWPIKAVSATKLSTTPMNIAGRLKLNSAKTAYDGILEFYINERLNYSDYGKRFRVSDTVFIDKLLVGFFPNSSTPTTDNYNIVIDDLYLFTFSDGDSTLTGNEQAASPYTIDVPGYPKGEDITDWGKFD